MRAIRLGFAAAAMLSALVTSPRASGAQTPTFPSQIELVTVDAITVVSRGAPSLIPAVPGGPVVRLLGLPLRGLADGDYELVLRALDRITGNGVERVEPFRLERSSGS